MKLLETIYEDIDRNMEITYERWPENVIVIDEIIHDYMEPKEIRLDNADLSAIRNWLDDPSVECKRLTPDTVVQCLDYIAHDGLETISCDHELHLDWSFTATRKENGWYITAQVEVTDG